MVLGKGLDDVCHYFHFLGGIYLHLSVRDRVGKEESRLSEDAILIVGLGNRLSIHAPLMSGHSSMVTTTVIHTGVLILALFHALYYDLVISRL